jgi:hypothetical protein
MRRSAAPLKSRRKRPRPPKTLRTPARRGGGSATAGGMNFQAAVTAIGAIYLVRGRPLGWLQGLVDDVPVSILAETGGAGDDVRLHYRDGSASEVQIKRGLQAGERLWTSLLKLSTAIESRTIDYGILIVSPDTSRSITRALSRDIKRLADGRTDGLGDLATTFQSKLIAAGLSAQSVCGRLRVVTVHGLDADDASIRTAYAELEHICGNKSQVGRAWDRLYRDASELAEFRGKRTASSVIRILRSSGIDIASRSQRVTGAILAKLTDWVYAANSSFSIFGAAQSLSIDTSWVPIKAVVHEAVNYAEYALAEALERYHDWNKRHPYRDSTVIDAETLGRFIRNVVIVAGPGAGKTTLLTKLARLYAQDGYPVLRVRLSVLAARIKTQGSGFTEGAFALGLDGSKLAAEVAQTAALDDWVLLCDGLDECGAEQEVLAQGLLDFVAGHPNSRIIVTTRPVGYNSSLLRNWRHYEIAPLESSAPVDHLAQLVRSIVAEKNPLYLDAPSVVSAALEATQARDLIARSPLLLGMAASLIVRGSALGRTRSQLYARMFQLIDEIPNARNPNPPASDSVLKRFIDILGWHVLSHPLSSMTAAVDRCGDQFAQEMGLTPLRARELAEQCLSYWQEVGLLERLHHMGEQTITFIHKTFGEFAAARYLRSLSTIHQRQTIEAIVDKDEWSEVIGFAASLGLTTVISTVMLGRSSPVAVALQMTERALALMSDADVPPEREVRRQIIERAFKYVRSERRISAYGVGNILPAVA